MGEEVVWCCSVPVALLRRYANGISGANLHDWTALPLYASDTMGNVEGLSKRV